MKRRGFTLIELLVVIAIIGILASILFPVFARARENARRSSCQSNLKQLGLAFAQYTGDFDGRYPQAWDITDLSMAGTASVMTYVPAGTTNEPLIWPAKIMPYLQSRQIFHCPSFDYSFSRTCDNPLGSIKNTRGWRDSDPVNSSGRMSNGSNVHVGASLVHYGYNVVFLGGGVYKGTQSCQDNPPTNGIGALETQLSATANTLLLVDNNYTHEGITVGPAFAHNSIYSYDAVGDHACTASGTEDAYDPFDGRHFDGQNVLFADGHVKWMLKTDVAYRPFAANCNNGWTVTDAKYIWNRL